MKILDILNEEVRAKTPFSSALLKKAPPKYAIMQLLTQLITNKPTSIMSISKGLMHHFDNLDREMVRDAINGLVNDGRIEKVEANVEAYKRR